MGRDEGDQFGTPIPDPDQLEQEEQADPEGRPPPGVASRHSPGR